MKEWVHELYKPATSGVALDEFLRLQPQAALGPQDLALCRNAAQTSWKVLALPDTRELSDLCNVARQLIAKESRAIACEG